MTSDDESRGGPAARRAAQRWGMVSVRKPAFAAFLGRTPRAMGFWRYLCHRGIRYRVVHYDALGLKYPGVSPTADDPVGDFAYSICHRYNTLSAASLRQRLERQHADADTLQMLEHLVAEHAAYVVADREYRARQWREYLAYLRRKRGHT